MRLYRSLLFAPGNQPRKVEKALGLDADGVILDLEDAVAVSEKDSAREQVLKALQGPRVGFAYVRVNAHHSPFLEGDLRTVVAPGVDGIMLPKLESVAQLEEVDGLIRQREREQGLEAGRIDLLPIIETARGLAMLESFGAVATGVRRLAFGAADYTLDLGMRWTPEERELDYPRSRIVLGSKLAELEPPIDTVFTHLGQIDALRRSANLARDLGFQGKLCIHPEQIAPVNEAFTPGAAEIERARRCVEAFEQAEAAGNASIQVDGQFIDYPVVEKARRTLGIAAAIAEKA